jgi:hypothetical protein
VDTNGNVHILSYDDVAPEKDARVDIYNPKGSEAGGPPFQVASIQKYNGEDL